MIQHESISHHHEGHALRVQIGQPIKIPDTHPDTPIPEAALQHARHRLRARPGQGRRHGRQRHLSFVGHHSQSPQRRHRRSRPAGIVRLLPANTVRPPSGGHRPKPVSHQQRTQQGSHSDSTRQDTGTHQHPHPPGSRQPVRRGQKECRDHDRRHPTLQPDIARPPEEPPLRRLRPSRYQPDHERRRKPHSVHPHPASSRTPSQCHPDRHRQQRHHKICPRVHACFDQSASFAFRAPTSGQDNSA